MIPLFVVLLLSPAGILPNAQLTPGARDGSVTADNIHETICAHGWVARARHVTLATKRKVFRLYGVDWRTHGDYEVDHLVSLELGGSNDVTNLWPEPYAIRLGARQKDRVENYLHRQVCAGRMTLDGAQRLIAHDWVSVFQTLRRVAP